MLIGITEVWVDAVIYDNLNSHGLVTAPVTLSFKKVLWPGSTVVIRRNPGIDDTVSDDELRGRGPCIAAEVLKFTPNVSLERLRPFDNYRAWAKLSAANLGS